MKKEALKNFAFNCSRTYNIVKTRDGQRGKVVGTYDTIDEARAALVDVLSTLATDDEQYIADEEDRQNEIDFVKEAADAEGLDASADIAKLLALPLPCIIDNLTREVVADTRDDMVRHDVFTWTIEQA